MKKSTVLSVNISKNKGEIKTPVEQLDIYEKGIKKDAHSGNWHRQVSLLDISSVNKFEKIIGRKINYGEFAENITTQGLCLYKMNILDKIIIKDVTLELTQIGKKCHGDGCNIFKTVGKCIMPTEGVFCRVLSTGTIKPEDEIIYKPKHFKAHVICLSDRASKGEYQDKSGPEIINILKEFFKNENYNCDVSYELIPDDEKLLEKSVKKYCSDKYDIIISTGGTGIGKRDITVDTVKSLIDKEIPGIMEHIRLKYGAEKPNALISRSIAGLRDETLIYTLPGSVKAVKEYMNEIKKTLLHSVFMINGIDAH